MRIAVTGTPLKAVTGADSILPVIAPGQDVSLEITFTTPDTGDIVLDVFLEREVGPEYLGVYSWPEIDIPLIPGVSTYGGSGVIRQNMVNTGLWRWRIRWTDEVGSQEVYTYFDVQDVIRIPSTTMVKSTIGGCGAVLSGLPRLSVIQGNDLSVDAFLYDNQGDPFIGLSSAIDGEVRLISVETRLVSGTVPFSDLTFDDPEFGLGSLLFDIPDSLTQVLDSGMYQVYLEVEWLDRVLEWPQLFNLNVLRQRI